MHIDALVVRTMPWREHDVRAVLYSRQLGKCSAIARGAQRATSRQGPALDAGSVIACELVTGRGGFLLTGAQAVSAWSHAKASSLRWAGAGFFLEALEMMVYDSQPDDALWESVVASLKALDDCSRGEIVEVFRIRQTELLTALGYGRQSDGLSHHEIDDRCNEIAGRQLSSLTLFRGIVRDYAR